MPPGQMLGSGYGLHCRWLMAAAGRLPFQKSQLWRAQVKPWEWFRRFLVEEWANQKLQARWKLSYFFSLKSVQ